MMGVLPIAQLFTFPEWNLMGLKCEDEDVTLPSDVAGLIREFLGPEAQKSAKAQEAQREAQRAEAQRKANEASTQAWIRVGEQLAKIRVEVAETGAKVDKISDKQDMQYKEHKADWRGVVARLDDLEGWRREQASSSTTAPPTAVVASLPPPPQLHDLGRVSPSGTLIIDKHGQRTYDAFLTDTVNAQLEAVRVEREAITAQIEAERAAKQKEFDRQTEERENRQKAKEKDAFDRRIRRVKWTVIGAVSVVVALSATYKVARTVGMQEAVKAQHE